MAGEAEAGWEAEQVPEWVAHTHDRCCHDILFES